MCVTTDHSFDWCKCIYRTYDVCYPHIDHTRQQKDDKPCPFLTPRNIHHAGSCGDPKKYPETCREQTRRVVENWRFERESDYLRRVDRGSVRTLAAYGPAAAAAKEAALQKEMEEEHEAVRQANAAAAEAKESALKKEMTEEQEAFRQRCDAAAVKEQALQRDMFVKKHHLSGLNPAERQKFFDSPDFQALDPLVKNYLTMKPSLEGLRKHQEDCMQRYNDALAGVGLDHHAGKKRKWAIDDEDLMDEDGVKKEEDEEEQQLPAQKKTAGYGDDMFQADRSASSPLETLYEEEETIKDEVKDEVMDEEMDLDIFKTKWTK